MCIFGGVNNPTAPEDGTAPGGAGDMTTTMRDCGNLLRCCVQADLSRRLPSRTPQPRQPCPDRTPFRIGAPIREPALILN